jgi:hypothetical protein
MAVFKIACPECGATLKSANPMPEGKKVKCPKCGKGFAVPAGGDVAEEPDKEPAARPKPAAKAAPAAKKAAPEAPPPKPDDEGGTYKFVDEPEKERGDGDEDEEEKPDITFGLDMSVKDPRGYAQESVVRPSNWVVLFGGLDIFLYVLVIGVLGFPFIFAEHFVDLQKPLGITAKEGDAVTIPPEKDWTPEQKAKVAALDAATRIFNILGILTLLVFIVLGGLSVLGAVKMQTLESWGWGLASAILLPIATLPVFLVTFGVVMAIFAVDDLLTLMGCIILGGALMAFSAGAVWWTIAMFKSLLDPKVKEGFEFEKEEAKKRY